MTSDRLLGLSKLVAWVAMLLLFGCSPSTTKEECVALCDGRVASYSSRSCSCKLSETHQRLSFAEQDYQMLSRWRTHFADSEIDGEQRWTGCEPAYGGVECDQGFVEIWGVTWKGNDGRTREAYGTTR